MIFFFLTFLPQSQPILSLFSIDSILLYIMYSIIIITRQKKRASRGQISFAHWTRPRGQKSRTCNLVGAYVHIIYKENSSTYTDYNTISVHTCAISGYAFLLWKKKKSCLKRKRIRKTTDEESNRRNKRKVSRV